MDFTKICRTCLVEEENTQMHSIFSFDTDQQYSTMLVACSTTEVTQHDGLPDRICLMCCEQLRKCLAFKTQCETSFKTLQVYRESVVAGTSDELKTKMLRANSPCGYLKYRDRELFAPEPNEKSVQTDEVTFYMCQMCDMKFVSEEALKMHRPIHQDSGFKCLVCSNMFGRLTHLRRHIAFAHPEANKEQFDIVCNVCDRRFARTDNLQRHLLTHATSDVPLDDDIEKQLDCADCKQSFKSKEDLMTHDATCLATLEKSIDSNMTEIAKVGTITDESITLSGNLNAEELPKYEVDSEDSDADYVPEEDVDCFEDAEEFSPKIVIEEIENDYPHDEDTTVVPIKRGRGRPRKTSVLPTIVIDKTDTTPSAKRGRPTSNTSIPSKSITTKETTSVFQCHKCPKIFTRLTHLNRHLVIHSDVKPFVCEVCDKGFTRLDHLNIHRHHHSPVKPYNCDICQRGFTRAAHLKKHKECRHTDPANNSEPPAYNKVCDICLKTFPNHKSLQLHMKIHTEKVYTCKFCRDTFSNKADYTEHNKLHVHEKPYLCSECGARFVRNDYLTVHMRRHNGDKPYKCQYCGKGFPRATDLNVHERYHTNVKTHVCTTCGKGFQRAYNLLVHMRVHTGERPYQCPHCEKSFAQGNDLKAHIRRHTGERYKCDVCNMGFIQGYHLTQHKKKKHGIDVQSHIQRVEKFVPAAPDDDEVEEILVNELNGVVYRINEEEHGDEDILEQNVMVDEEELQGFEDRMETSIDDYQL